MKLPEDLDLILRWCHAHYDCHGCLLFMDGFCLGLDDVNRLAELVRRWCEEHPKEEE